MADRVTVIRLRNDEGDKFDDVLDKVPAAGEPVVYRPSDNFGEYTKLKIGDGQTALGKLDFVGDDIREDLAKVAELTGASSNSLSNFMQHAEQNYATKSQVAQIDNSIAQFKSEVTNNYATQDLVANVNENLAKFEQEVANTYAKQSMVTEVRDDLAIFEQTVADNYATTEFVSSVTSDSSAAIAQLRQEVTDTYATNTSVAELKTETTNAIAASEEKATETYASKIDYTSFKSETDESLVRVEQKADANSASIGIVVENGKAKGSILIDAINDESVAKISADRLDIEGKTLNIKVPSTNITGALTIGQLPSTVAETSDIPTNISELTNDAGYQDATGVVSIAKGAITADFIKTLGLEVGNQITMGPNATISWDNVSNKDNVASKSDISSAKTDAINTASADATTKADAAKNSAVSTIEAKGYQTAHQVTQITKDTVTTSYVNALNVTAKSIDVDSLSAISANMGEVTAGKLKSEGATCEGDDITKFTGLTIDLTTPSICGPGFKLNKDGMKMSGEVIAKKGKIGDFTLENGILFAENPEHKGKYGVDDSVFIGAYDINRVYNAGDNFFKYEDYPEDAHSWVITAGSNFGVTAHGSLFCKSGVISGFKIKDNCLTTAPEAEDVPGTGNVIYLSVSDLTGNIAGQSRSDWRFTIGNNFGVDKSGAIFSSAAYLWNVSARSGTIGCWNIESTGILTSTTSNDIETCAISLRSDDVYLKVTDLTDQKKFSWKATSLNRTGINFSCGLKDNSSSAPYVGYLKYDPESTHPINMYSPNGVELGYDVTIKNQLTVNSDTYGYNVKLGYDEFAVFYKDDETPQNYGTITGTGSSFVIQTENNKKFVIRGGGSGVTNTLEGSWYLTNGNAVTSDRNLKHSIEDMTTKHSTFFDELRPTIFKYNDGNSNRYHFGYIAQEVDEALTKAGMTRQDFGGVCIADPDTDEEFWALRYDEFIPLNTFEIQKLKARVKELEELVASLTNN